MAVAQPRGRATATPNGKRQFTLDLPMLSIQVRQPDVRMPHIGMPHIEMPHMEMPRVSRQELGHYVDIARTFLPAPERMAYYGALGALAAFGVLEWPVAAAIGAGTIVAQRRPGTPMFGRQPSRQPSRARETAPAAKEEPTPPSKRATTTTRRATTTARRGAATTTAGAGGRKTATTTAGAGGRKTTTGKTTSTSSSTSRRKSTSPGK
ncbi:hypothetical protein [Nonomuraea sp. NPDC049400]|uniref:hypothetical protein n=1 Tax=Nonomuraea sp. NPDC049400 TaxID=3364352 RepID=UPI0037A01F12